MPAMLLDAGRNLAALVSSRPNVLNLPSTRRSAHFTVAFTRWLLFERLQAPISSHLISSASPHTSNIGRAQKKVGGQGPWYYKKRSSSRNRISGPSGMREAMNSMVRSETSVTRRTTGRQDSQRRKKGSYGTSAPVWDALACRVSLIWGQR